MDEPEAVISIIEKYPDFKVMYGQVYNICRNIEEAMSMFSEELRELEQNNQKLEQMEQTHQKELDQKTMN